MAVFVVVVTTFSDAFDKNFLERMSQLGPEVTLVKETSEEDLKIYCLKLDTKFAGVNSEYFLDEFFKFDQDILGITFLRKEEDWIL